MGGVCSVVKNQLKQQFSNKTCSPSFQVWCTCCWSTWWIDTTCITLTFPRNWTRKSTPVLSIRWWQLPSSVSFGCYSFPPCAQVRHWGIFYFPETKWSIGLLRCVRTEHSHHLIRRVSPEVKHCDLLSLCTVVTQALWPPRPCSLWWS